MFLIKTNVYVLVCLIYYCHFDLYHLSLFLSSYWRLWEEDAPEIQPEKYK